MKNIGIIIGVIALAIVGIIAFTGNSDDTANNNETLSGTFKDIMVSGKSYQCTFSKSDEQGDMNGQVYVAKTNMIRGDYHMTDLDGNTFDVEVIQDGEFNYVWGTSPFGDMALKTKLDETDTADNDANFVESDKEFDFECKKWKVQNSMFTPPSDVNFNEFTIPTIEIPTGASNIQTESSPATQDICSSCDSAPAGVAREQCLQAISVFGCE